MSRRLVFLLALAAGATVANLYYAQPLLAMIARELGVAASAVSIVPMATQLGYATGLLLLVPLGDVIERRKLIVTTTLCVVCVLLVVAASHGLAALIASSFVLGAVTIVPQLIVPFAAHLASESDRGRIVGIVMSGLLVGVLLSRTVSGIVAGSTGWRTMYLAAAGATALLALVLRAALPVEPPETRLRYRDLMRSLVPVMRDEPVLRRHAIIGAAGFAAFSAFWTTLAFRIASLSPWYGTETVGAFGIIGVTGVVVAPMAGRYADRLGPRVMNGSGLLLISLSFVVMALSGHSLLALAIAVVILDAGAQMSQLSNQIQIFALDASIRNRVNAIYMVAFFTGGALGSALGGFAWQRGGWVAVCALGATLPLIGIVALMRR